MSVDQRIREGLHNTNTQLSEPDIARALECVTTGARTAARRRGLVVVGLAAAAAAAVVVAVGVSDGEDVRRPSPVDRTSSEAPEVGPPAATRWGWAYVSDPVTFADMEQNLREHGLGEWVDPLHEKWGDFEGQIELDFESGELTASIPETPVSHTNDYLVFRHFLSFEGSDSQLEATATELDGGGQRLTLTLTKSHTAAVDGIPGEVYERALYTTVPFNEIPPPGQPDLRPGTYTSEPVRFNAIARDLRFKGMGTSVELLREMWGDTDEQVQVRLELDGETANTSIPGTQIILTGPYTTDGSLIRIEDDDPQDDNGWIEFTRTPVDSPAPFELNSWDAGPATWNGLPVEVIAEAIFMSARFTPVEE